MKQFVEFLASSLSGQPEQVSVTEIEDDKGALLELRVADEDVNHLIGKQGRTIKAMRSLLAAAAAKNGKRFRLKLITGADLPDEAAETGYSDSLTSDREEQDEAARRD